MGNKLKIIVLLISMLTLTACSAKQTNQKWDLNADIYPNYKTEEGGVSIWPPEGEMCENFVKCCWAANDYESSVGLFCKMLNSTNKDCKEKLSTTVQQIAELSELGEFQAKIPTECQ